MSLKSPSENSGFQTMNLEGFPVYNHAPAAVEKEGGMTPSSSDHFPHYLVAIQILQQQGQVFKMVSAQPKGSLQASQVVQGTK